MDETSRNTTEIIMQIHNLFPKLVTGTLAKTLRLKRY